ncbi:MAG: GGDEF domain-containing protein [Roseovarius sp.]|jgi:diguanylate cyclase|nr:GGDEF domain-containing protein [Roseovarius sp.]
MSWHVRTGADVWRFTAAIAAAALLGSIALRFVVLPSDLATRTLLPGSVMALVLATPIAWFVGQRMREVSRLGERLEHALHHDMLTGVRTRLSFYERAAEMTGITCAVIVTDIDNFKGFNDRYGHFAGDQALRQFAAMLTANCRADDIVARFGGEEFVIVIMGAHHQEGISVAERLAARVRASPIFFGEHTLRLTASFGVAALLPGGDIDSAIQQADRALYRAKHAGRDRALLFDPALDGAAIPMGAAAQ